MHNSNFEKRREKGAMKSRSNKEGVLEPRGKEPKGNRSEKKSLYYRNISFFYKN
jgi:hypothetical protein